LLLLIIDFYKIFVILCQGNAFLKFLILVKSWIFLLIFSVLLNIYFLKIKIYRHHKLVIYYYVLCEVYSLILVFSTKKVYEPILWLSTIGISFIESMAVILIKNLMEIKLFSAFKVCYVIGIINFIISLIILIILSSIKCNSEIYFCKEDEYFLSLYSVYNNSNKTRIIAIFLVFISLISGINKYLINHYELIYTIYN